MSKSSSHFLKNPAAGGGVRSSSSPHQPAVGTPPNQDSPFVQAIFKKIKSEAEKDGIKLDLYEVRKFAREYAEANPPINPPKGKIFGQDHVDAAFERFKEQYVPPQPVPQPIYRLSQRDLLIRSICERGIAALPLPLQEQFKKFKIIHELCCLAPSDLTDDQLKQMQRDLCTPSTGILLGVLSIERDPSSETGLRINLYRQSRIPRRCNPSAITIVCVSCYGKEKSYLHVGNLLDEYSTEDRIQDSGVNVMGQMSLAQRELDRSAARSKFVPSDESCFAQVSSSCCPEFSSFCQDGFLKFGFAFLPPFSAPSATEVHAPSVKVAGEASCDSDFILCHHLKTVRNGETFTPCNLCLEGPPGSGRIFDRWGQTVIGYKCKE